MTVNPSTMRLGIASILIGLVGAYGVRVMMDEEEAPPAPVEVKQFLVPLASQDLPVGRVIHLGDISLRQMNAEMMKQESMPLDQVMMSADQIIGRQLRKPLRLGEPFLTTSVYLEKAGPGYELKPGYRAVSVSVSMARGGYAEAGDVVDVYFTSTPTAPNPRTGQGPIPQKTILVTDAVTVLDVTRPDATRAPLGNRSRDPSFLLQVLPEQVAKYQALQTYGDFSFMIRLASDVSVAKNVDADGTTIEELLGIKDEPPPQPPPTWITEYYRRGSRNAQYFPIPPPTPEQIQEMQRQYAEQQAKLAAQGGDQAVADASPLDDEPAPPPQVRRRPTLRGPDTTSSGSGQGSAPQIPYRSTEPTTATPLPPSPPSSDPSNSDTSDPFGDDEVLP